MVFRIGYTKVNKITIQTDILIGTFNVNSIFRIAHSEHQSNEEHVQCSITIEHLRIIITKMSKRKCIQFDVLCVKINRSKKKHKFSNMGRKGSRLNVNLNKGGNKMIKYVRLESVLTR